MSSTTIAIASLGISGVSALISFLIFLRNRSKLVQLLRVDLKNETRFAIPEGEIIVLNEHGKQYPLPGGFMVRFNFLNPSPNDIAYFHYSFLHEKDSFEGLTSESLSWYSETPTFIWNRGFVTKTLPIPKKVVGVFKANSLTPFYAFVPFYNKVPSKITFRIRFAVRSFPFFTIDSNYKTFEYTYDLTTYREELQKELELMKKPDRSVQNVPNDLTNQTNPNKTTRSRYKENV